jgi:sucrose phosphorylase
LVLHSLQTGNAEKLTRWAQTLALPSDRVTFFNFLASHDGIGLNPARGILSDAEIEDLVRRTQAHSGYISYKDMPDGSRLPYEMNINYLDALSNPAAGEPTELAARKILAAHSILLSLQGVPGIYFHSMFGSRGDRSGAEVSGIPRRINREKNERLHLEREIKDDQCLRGCVWSGMQMLLRIRSAQPSFHPQAAQRILVADERIFAVCRLASKKEQPLVCLHNVSAQPAPVGSCLAEATSAQSWTDLLTGRSYGADAADQPLQELAGFEILWLQANKPS